MSVNKRNHCVSHLVASPVTDSIGKRQCAFVQLYGKKSRIHPSTTKKKKKVFVWFYQKKDIDQGFHATDIEIINVIYLFCKIRRMISKSAIIRPSIRFCLAHYHWSRRWMVMSQKSTLDLASHASSHSPANGRREPDPTCSLSSDDRIFISLFL
ncbi:uncharacterized protein BYT42DRAFT_568855 [Radiomyces spectabilis]|uniref:uncharacterized protein n=1 Tax=Radiomyces spectabilis TaxID=64574 RepID=UPI00221EEA84|nr:uncharacterized protein BYT42DRAFT_568855 [Radiomyces spectabilis]KAI8379452.1 hypothetical protein BYT42DRAFT_568855 [Radiomyces spectabilis]